MWKGVINSLFLSFVRNGDIMFLQRFNIQNKQKLILRELAILVAVLIPLYSQLSFPILPKKGTYEKWCNIMKNVC